MAGHLKRLGTFGSRLLRHSPTLLPLLILVAGVLVREADPLFIQRLNSFTFDTMQRIHPRPYDPGYPVRILDIDDASLAKYGQWPWSRNFIAQIIDKLKEDGAASIAFDIVFAEPDRTSPENALGKFPQLAGDPAIKAKIDQLPSNDQVFAQALSRSNAALGFVVDNSRLMDHPPMQRGNFANNGTPELSYLQAYTGATVNLPILEAAAPGDGVFLVELPEDYTIRRVPIVFRLKDRLYPSLAAEALRLAQGAKTNIIKWSGTNQELNFGAATGITSIKIGAVVVPTDSAGKILLYDSGPKPARFISVKDFLDPAFDASQIEGKIVLMGTSAAGLKDLRETPLNPAGAGVEVHAQILEQMVTATFLYQPDFQRGIDIIYLVVLGLLLIFIMRKTGAVFSAPVALLFVGGSLLASWFAFTEANWLVGPIYPAATMALIFIAGTSLSYIRSEAERRQVRDAFSLYLAPEMVRRVAANPAALNLGGEGREVTVMFSDIRGFTTISEGLKPAELTAMLNGFLTPMTDIIQKDHKGTIDKYMGDAIMAFWNAPLDDPDHAANACRAALDMRRRLRVLNEEWEKAGVGYPHLNIGIGLNSGPVTVGNFGSQQRLAYSIIGDAANLASRLEGQTKAYGVDILISEEVLKRAPGFHVVELDLIRVKGKREPARIYALIGLPEEQLSAERAAVVRFQADFLAAYRGGDFPAARQALAAAHQAAEASNWRQGYYDVMRHRMDELGDVAPEGWEGVYEATSK